MLIQALIESVMAMGVQRKETVVLRTLYENMNGP